ncbi:MAG TPA: septum formation family protein, partial [Acidimicrobiales bacterium]
PSERGRTMNAAPPGWNPDPTGRHEYRYWDGSSWTDDVADGGTTSTDPLSGPAAGGGAEPTAPIDQGAGGEPTAPYEPGPQPGPGGYEPGPQPGGYGTPPGGPGGYGTPPGGYGTGPGQAYGGYGAPPGPAGPPDAYGGAPPPPVGPRRSGPPVALLVGLGVLAIVVIVVLALVLTGDDDGETATDETTTTPSDETTAEQPTTTAAPQTTEGGPEDADVFSLEVGDCMVEETPSGEVQSVPVVPCDQPHASEIFFIHMLDNASLPSSDEMEQIATDVCLREFEGFVGVPYEDSVLLVTWLEPTQESWDAGDRELLCIAVDPEGDATGSFAGTAR